MRVNQGPTLVVTLPKWGLRRDQIKDKILSCHGLPRASNRQCIKKKKKGVRLPLSICFCSSCLWAMSFSFQNRLSTSSEGLARKDGKHQCPRRLTQALSSLTSKVFPKTAPGCHAQSNAVYPPQAPLIKWQPVKWDFLVPFTTMGPWGCIQMKVNFCSPSFWTYSPKLNKVPLALNH